MKIKTAAPRAAHSIAISGISGSGKTHTALRLAKALGSKILVIDVGERESSGGYAQEIPHNVAVVGIGKYGYSFGDIEQSLEIAKEYDILVVDSLSGVWGNVLRYKETLDSIPGTNQFANWRKPGEQWDKLLLTLKTLPIPIIATIRSKTKYEVGEKGKPQRMGYQPIVRDGTEYEFDVWCSMYGQCLTVEQPRHHAALRGLVLTQPTVEDLAVFA
jgi:AAA domain